MKTTIIIQARMTSSRFPGKVMAKLLGLPVLEHVITRARMVTGVDTVMVACPDAIASNPIVKACKKLGVPVFKGSETNVLDRYYGAALEAKADIIMRITSDCPFFSPSVAADVLQYMRKGDLDYASNVFPRRTFPKGFDCEVMTFDALEAANRNARSDYEREHVTPWLQRTDGVILANLVQNEDHSNVNLCVDYPGDIERLETMFWRGEIHIYPRGEIPQIKEVSHETRH